MKKLTVLILLLATLLCSCTPKIDTSQFTEDNPYIVDNFEINDDMSKISLEETYNLPSMKPVDVMEYIANEKQMTFRVKKQDSESYYWESNGETVFFTITYLQVLEKLHTDNSEYYDSISINDIIKILEYYSVDPNGNFLAATKKMQIEQEPVFNNSPYDKFPYKIMHDKNFRFTYSAPDNVKYLTYCMVDTDSHPQPFVKPQTEYILIINSNSIINNENEKIKISSGYKYGSDVTSVELPYDLMKGIYYSKYLFELSENAYTKALGTLEKYGETLHTQVITNSYEEYDRVILKIWELYGDKVGN